MSHELSQTMGDNPYYNVSGYTHTLLPQLYPFERPEYTSLMEAVMAAKMRSMLHEQLPLRFDGYGLSGAGNPYLAWPPTTPQYDLGMDYAETNAE